MRIYITWRSASVTPEGLLPDLAVLIFKPFADRFNFALKNDRDWHNVSFDGFPHIMTAMCVSDHVLALLREEGVENPVRKFEGENADELNHLLNRVDVIEAAVREAVVKIKKTRSFDMIPLLGKRLKEIRLLLERRVSAQRGGLPV